MQKRIEVPTVGTPYPFLKAKLLTLVKAWPDDSLTVTNGQLDLLCSFACDFELANKTIPPAWFVSLFQSAPDFVLAVLTKARHEWNKLGRTKFGRLQMFIATNSHFKPHGNYAARPWARFGSELAATDGDISQAYEIAHGGESVEKELVTKARKKVAAEVRRGIKLHEKLTKPQQNRGGKVLKKRSE